MDCAICFEVMDKANPGVTRWGCQHQFHAECIARWAWSNKSCPMCRQEAVCEPKHPEPTMKPDEIARFALLPHVPVKYHSIYHEKWNYPKCHRENHMVIYIRGFGVIGICTVCRISKCYNLAHPG